MQNIKVQIIKYKINDNSIFTKNDNTILDILNELNPRTNQNFLEINISYFRKFDKYQILKC